MLSEAEMQVLVKVTWRTCFPSPFFFFPSSSKTVKQMEQTINYAGTFQPTHAKLSKRGSTGTV